MSDAIEAARRTVKALDAWDGDEPLPVRFYVDAGKASRALLDAVGGREDNSSPAVAAPILTSDAIDGIVHLVGLDVSELPDRTSPDDMPDMMLVTGDELEDIVRHALQAFLAYAPAAAHLAAFDWELLTSPASPDLNARILALRALL